MVVLVTGGAGFVGLNLVEELASNGTDVVSLSRHSIPSTITDELQAKEASVVFEVGDVRDRELVERLCRRRKIDGIVHAAVITADARRESRMPEEITSVNIIGTISVLQAARAIDCRRIVYVGSGQAYGKTHREGKVIEEERAPSLPEELYGITKLAAEQIALRLGDLWQLDVISMRLGSVFGPWEFDTGDRDMLSPQLRLARMALTGQEAILPSHEIWRDWIYSRDVARGLAAGLLSPTCAHRLYHLTSSLNWKGHFLKWCDALQHAYPRFSWHVATESEMPNVSQVVTSDRAPMSTARIKDDLGFEPRFGPSEAYDDFLHWLRQHESFVT